MLVRRVLLFTVVVLTSAFGATRQHSRKLRPRTITQCSWDGTSFEVADFPDSRVLATFGDLQILGRMKSGEDQGAVLRVKRDGKVVYEAEAPELANPNGWVGYSNNTHSFAINTSNGGAAGGWSVLIFRESEDGRVQDLSSTMHTVERHFSARHDCKTRGNNYEAIQWRSDTTLLISASVYGTSDCGVDMGHTEGYLLDVLTNRIAAHYTEREMLRLPYVCTYNVRQPGDPDPQ